MSVAAVNVERWLHFDTGREAIVVARSRTPDGDTVYRWIAPVGDEVIEDMMQATKQFEAHFVRAATGSIVWRVGETRPHHWGYDDGGERIGEAFASIRKELGFETSEDFSAWLYVEDRRRYGPHGNNDVPPPLLDAVEFPALGWGSMMFVLEAIARAVGVSPGTLLDEVLLRASSCDVQGREDEE